MKDCDRPCAWDQRPRKDECRPPCPPPGCGGPAGCPCGGGCGLPCGPRGNYLMQRILGSGRLHRRCQTYDLQLTNLPCQAAAPLQAVDVTASDHPPVWEALPCPERGALALLVRLPLLVRLRDRQGCLFTAQAVIEETLRLRLCCPEQESWRGSIYLQGAARLCSCACPCGGDGCCPARLEVCLEGFLLLPCAAFPPAPACPGDERPWYPQMPRQER